MHISNLVKHALANGGRIVPLLLDPALTKGTGLMNPSIYIDGDQILCNVRHVNYTLFHSEGKKFHHFYGPLQYIHPENDCTLTTTNYLCHLDEALNITRTDKIDTGAFDVPPIWEFVGMEDVRLFRWDGHLYGSGVRRDTTTNGVGRMELCEYDVTTDTVKEISRIRIPAPGADNTYCEKNWMPILDIPYHYIKWSNPTEVVKVDLNGSPTLTAHLEESRVIEGLCDFRGGSQVISWQGYYLAIIHEVRLFNSELGRKDAKYYHRFVLWDKGFNIVTFSELFDFMEGDIEFSCGLALRNSEFLVSFGFQDNAAFVLGFPESIMWDLLKLERPKPPLAAVKIKKIAVGRGISNDSVARIPVIGTAIVNGIHWLRRLLASIDYPTDTFVIFNNNGRHQLTKELDEIAATTHPFIKNIQVCHLPSNIGCPAAWNLIIKSFPLAPYWLICNHDIEVSFGYLEKMVKHLEDPEVGVVHGEVGDYDVGSWDIFIIRDFVVQKYGLFDENFYPAYCEDMDYLMRLTADGNKVKRVIGVGGNLLHGDTADYNISGSQTARVEPELREKIDAAHLLNQQYIATKWGSGWTTVSPAKYPLDNPSLPLSYTSYDLGFIRFKHLGF